MRDLRDPLNNMRDLSSALMKRGYVTRCISARHCVRSIDDSCLIQSARLSQSALQCATFVVRFIMRDQSDPLPEGFFFCKAQPFFSHARTVPCLCLRDFNDPPFSIPTENFALRSAIFHSNVTDNIP